MSEETPLAFALNGARGRMARAILAITRDQPDAWLLVAALSRSAPPEGTPQEGAPHDGAANYRPLSPAALLPAAVVIDFSHAEACRALVAACCAARRPLLCGTTGLGAPEHKALDAAARTIAVIESANTSLGITLLAHLVTLAAQRLDEGFDLEILESHHRGKQDAPSGTALLLGRAAAKGRKITQEQAFLPALRSGTRPRGGIGFASQRGGSTPGSHEVLFCGTDETLILSHHAHDRRLFAQGALVAARWLADQPPGRYHMADVLSLT